MEPEESVVITALSVDEAIILGLTRLAATREEVEIEVLDEGSRGFLGLGTREAAVRLTRRPAAVVAPPSPPVVEEPVAATPVSTPVASETSPAPEAVAEAGAVAPSAEVEIGTPQVVPPAPVPPLPETPAKSRRRPHREQKLDNLNRELLEKTAMDVSKHLFAGLNIQFSMSWEQESRPTLWISVRGADADMLVGPRAQTLNAVQYLFRSLMHRLEDGNYNVVVDADGYRKRRQRSLESLARKLANQAVSSGHAVKMRPMPAHERRFVHILLRKDDRVKTESTGKGRDRAITIVPKN